ncbi:MAG: hypothetical protein IPK16_08085 [Anaerolineales bacterium]|nr:hypothetical protein [Anaerolineales bacterium]
MQASAMGHGGKCWAMHHIQGYGYPTFLIQAPLGLYLAEIFVLLGAGFTLAAKLAWSVGVLAGAWGAYALVRHWLTRGAMPDVPIGPEERTGYGSRDAAISFAAVTAGLLYTYFPYHIADLYVRGALNDALLLGWLPWLFLVFDRLLLGGATPGWTRRLGIAMLVLAGTLLTHTFALLSIAPLLVTFVLFRLAFIWRAGGFPWRTILLAAAGGAGALLLTSIFLIPLLTEGRYLQQQVYVSNTYDFRNHFVQIGQFFSPYWGFGYSDDPIGANDGMPFQLGALLILFAVVAPFVGLRRQARLRAEMGYLWGMGLALLFVMSPLAQPLWEAAPALAVIQFPWRFLALAGFLFSLLAAVVAWNLLPLHVPEIRPPTQTAEGLLVVALLGIYASTPYIRANLSPVEPWREDGRAIIAFENEHPDMIAYTEWVKQPFIKTPMSADYLSPDYAEHNGSAGPLTRLQIISGQGMVTSQYSRGSSSGGVVQMATPGEVRINEFYFPGWQVTIDGQPVTAWRADPMGVIAVDGRQANTGSMRALAQPSRAQWER